MNQFLKIFACTGTTSFGGGLVGSSMVLADNGLQPDWGPVFWLGIVIAIVGLGLHLKLKPF